MTIERAKVILENAAHNGDLTPIEEALFTLIAQKSKASRAKQVKSLMEDSGYSRKESTALADAGFGEVA